jgi:hypothetical protein
MLKMKLDSGKLHKSEVKSQEKAAKKMKLKRE